MIKQDKQFNNGGKKIMKKSIIVCDICHHDTQNHKHNIVIDKKKKDICDPCYSVLSSMFNDAIATVPVAKKYYKEEV